MFVGDASSSWQLDEAHIGHFWIPETFVQRTKLNNRSTLAHPKRYEVSAIKGPGVYYYLVIQ